MLSVILILFHNNYDGLLILITSVILDSNHKNDVHVHLDVKNSENI